MQSSYKMILLFVVLLIILFQCKGEDSIIKDVNTAEKMYFKAGEFQRDILSNHSIAGAEDYKKAETAYRRIINKFGTKSENSIEIKKIVQKCWLALAELMLLQKKYEGAIEIYKEMIEKSPSDRELCGTAQYSIATCLGKLNRVDEAIEAYKRVIETYPPVFNDTVQPNLKILQIPILIARLYKKVGKNSLVNIQYEDAKKYYVGVISKWPNTPVALAAENQMAMIYGDQENWEKSVEILNNIIVKYPEMKGLLNIMFSLGNIYFHQLGRPEKAANVYKQVIHNYPQNQELGKVYLALGKAYSALRYYDKARELLRYVLEKYRKNYNTCLKAQLVIAKSYELENNWAKALNEYQWAIESYPRSLQALDLPIYIADYYRDHGKEHLAKTAYENAVKEYKQAVGQFPDSDYAKIAHKYLATTYMRLEKWPEACETLNALLKLKLPVAKYIDTYLTLGSLYEKKMKYDQKAIEVYTDLLQKFPDISIAQSITARIAALQQKLAHYQRANRPPVKSKITSTNKISTTSVDMGWQQNMDYDFYCYKLVRSQSPGTGLSDLIVAEIFKSQQVNYIDSDLREENTYYYRLFVFDKGGLFSESEEVSVKLDAPVVLTVVKLQAHCINWTSVSLTWTQSQEKEFDAYKIYRSRSAGVTISSEFVKSIYDKYQTQFTDTGLNEETTYYYRVYVFNKRGDKKAGNEVKINTTANTPPAAVVLDKPLPINKTTVKLSWSRNIDDDFSMYRIYRSDQLPVSLNNTPIQMSSDNLTNFYKDSGLKPDNIYYYKIVVYDKGGLYAESNEVSVEL